MSARRTRVAAYAICVDRDAILLARLTQDTGWPGYWGLPGGGLEWGEAPMDAVLRELREETGLEGEVDALLDVTSLVDEIHSIQIYYRVRVTGGALRDEAEGTTDRAEWIALADVRQRPIVDTVAHALRLLS